MLHRLAQIFVCFAALLGLSVAAHSVPPRIDADPQAYFHYLLTSPDPDAQAIRRQIESGPADLARERTLAKAAGIVVDVKDLQKPLPPPDQNAAPLYEKLAQLRKDKPEGLPRFAGVHWPLSRRYALTPDQLAQMRKWYADRQDLYTLLHEATDKPQCVFSRDWSNPANDYFRSFAAMRENTRLLQTESYLLAQQGRYSDALQNQARGFRLAEHTASDRTLISYLVAVAIDDIALSGMRDILQMAGPNAELSAQAEKILATQTPRLSLRDALRGDAAISLSSLDMARKASPKDFANLLSHGDIPNNGTNTNPSNAFGPNEQRLAANLIDAAEAVYLRRMQELVAVADRSPAERSAAFAGQSDAPADNPVETLQEIIFPVFLKTQVIGTRPDAQAECLRAGAALLSVKAKTGAFPDALPATFTDPFNGKPLGYRREGDTGFVVYSVGSDGKFDGGKPGDKWTNQQSLFRYPPPPPVPVTDEWIAP